MPKKPFACLWAIVLLVCMLAASPAQLAAAQQDTPSTPLPKENVLMDFRPVPVYADSVSSNFRQAAPTPRLPNSSQATNMMAATFEIEYVANGSTNILGDVCTTFPENAKAAFNYAANIWATQLNSPVPIAIEACWSDMASGVLGHSAAIGSFRDFTGAPRPNTYYPAALASVYNLADINDLYYGPGAPEISIAYNSDFSTSFYYGTDGSTPINNYDFASVVLHEIAHGLGFAGLMRYSGGTGYYDYNLTTGAGSKMPSSYDRFTQYGTGPSGTPLTNTTAYPNPSTALGSALTSQNIYFNGANAVAANGGTSVKLYTPSSWAGGSSYSHLDYNTYWGTVNSLMIYAVSAGSSNHNPGPVTMGLLTDVGWPFPPTAIALSNNSVASGQAAGTLVGTLSATDPNSPEVFIYSLVSGTGATDNASFEIIENQLRTAVVFPGASTRSIRVRVMDRNLMAYDRVFSISVTGATNNPPTNITLSASSVAENMPALTTVGAFTTTDPDAGNTFSYALTTGTGCPGTDNASFNISGSSLRTGAAFNYEAKNSYAVCVSSTDQGGLSTIKAFTISVTNANETPTDISLSASSVAENQPADTVVGALTTTDPDTANTFTYALTTGTGCPGTDNASFNISGSSLRASATFNYEAKNSYAVCVRSTDQGGLSVLKALTVSVSNVNETPTDISLSASSVAENLPALTTVGALSTTDPDAGSTFSYALTTGTNCPGTDNASFDISGSNLRTGAAFNYEAKNSYAVCVRSTDQGSLSTIKAFTISVTNANEAPTDISLSASSVAENQPANTVVGTLSSTDPEGGSFTYALATGAGCPGTDNASFNISGSNLRTSASFNYEAKNSYAICVSSTDQTSLSWLEPFTITVTNANEAPTDISLSASSVAENQPANTVVGSLSSTDPDAGNTFSYALTTGTGCPGTDNASFNISGSSLRTSAAFNYEAKNSYAVCVSSTDQGGLSTIKAFTITVSNINEAPTDITLTPATVAEDQPSGTTVGALSTTDPDAGSTFSYTLSTSAGCPGTDNASFDVSGSSLVTAAVFDADIKSSYAVCVRSADQGGLAVFKPFTITITGLNHAPTAINLDASEVDENQPANTTVGLLDTTDADPGDSHAYSLTSTQACPGTDNASFNINGSTLRTSAVFNYEAKSNYAICVRTADQGGLTFDQAFTITVGDLNERPTNISLDSATVEENSEAETLVGEFNAADPDLGDTFTYSLVSTVSCPGADNARFTILTGGSLQTVESFDFETRSSYAICVRAADQDGLSFDKIFTISVINVNEAADEILLSSDEVGAGSPAGTTIGALTANDPDLNDPLTFSLSAGQYDNDLFAITGNVLRIKGPVTRAVGEYYDLLVIVEDEAGAGTSAIIRITVVQKTSFPIFLPTLMQN